MLIKNKKEMWVKCHICKGTSINPYHKDSDKMFHEGTEVSIYQCLNCYLWYINCTFSQKGYIWVDDTEDPISPLPSPS